MAQQVLSDNDGLPVSQDKINDNFTELYSDKRDHVEKFFFPPNSPTFYMPSAGDENSIVYIDTTNGQFGFVIDEAYSDTLPEGAWFRLVKYLDDDNNVQLTKSGGGLTLVGYPFLTKEGQTLLVVKTGAKEWTTTRGNIAPHTHSGYDIILGSAPIDTTNQSVGSGYAWSTRRADTSSGDINYTIDGNDDDHHRNGSEVRVLKIAAANKVTVSTANGVTLYTGPKTPLEWTEDGQGFTLRKIDTKMWVLLENVLVAKSTFYDNSSSGMTATDVQEAIDEVEGRTDTVETDKAAIQHYSDFCIPAGAMRPADTNGAELTSVEGMDAMAFDAATEESVVIAFRLPDDYNGGVLRWSVDWDAVATASGTAVFGLSGGAFDNDEALSTALGTERTITDTLLAVGDRHKPPNDGTGITLAGTPAAGDWVKLKLVVKTSGTIAVDVLVLGLQLQYQTKTTQPGVWS